MNVLDPLAWGWRVASDLIYKLFWGWGVGPLPCPGEVATGSCTINSFTGSVSFSNLSGEVTLK